MYDHQTFSFTSNSYGNLPIIHRNYFFQISNFNLSHLKISKSNSSLSLLKTTILINTLDMVGNVDGDLAEMGVYKGGSAYLIHKKYPNRILHLFDSFEGMKAPIQNNEYHKEKDFSDTSLDKIRKIFKNHPNVNFYKGWFPSSIPENIYDKKFSFVHIDGDFYESTVDSIEFFYPRLSKNGVIIIDDYHSINVNVKRALKEMQQKFKFRFYVPNLEQAIIKKTV